MKIQIYSLIKTIIILVSLLFSQLVIGQAEIIITKEIINNPINCKQFDVTLTITGNPPVEAQEVVLLIDVSGSMGDEVDDGTGTGNTEQIMEFAKDAAKDFVDELLSPTNNPTGNNKVAIVKYASSATILTNLTSNKTDLDSFINGLNAGGGTNMEDALIKADEVLSPPNAQGTFNCGTSRTIILLTDGVPTWRNGASNWCSSTTLNTDCQTRAFTAATNAETTTVSGDVYNQSIYTVGFTGTLTNSQLAVSENTLNTIQNSGAFYTDNAADLTNIYNVILGQLVAAATALPGESLVSEQIPNIFQIVSGSLNSSSSIDPNKGGGSFTGQTINWVIDKIVEETVTLNYSILTTDSNSCGNVTAGISTMKYLNSSCIETTKIFDNPTICVPCPEIDIAINRELCTNSMNYSFVLNGETCGVSSGTYEWEFYLNNTLVGVSSTENGTFDYTGLPDFTGSFKAELTYNGTYTTGCILPPEMKIKTIVIPDEIVVSSVVNNAKCNNSNDGNIDLTVSGGYGSYQYDWSNGATTKNISGLEAGNYSVTITDIQGCSLVTENFTITSPDELSLSLLKSDLSCGGNDGGIDLTVTGGTPNYTYLWSNGATTEDVSNLIAGIYSVTVTDGNGCTKTISTTLISIDTESPTITVPETLNIEGCDENNITSINSRYAFSLTPVSVDIISFVTTGYSANDDGDIAAITYKDEITSDDGCIIKVLRTFTVTDTCGKTGTDSILITIKDTIKPTFTVPNDAIIYADENCNFDSSVAKTGDVSDESDNCDTTLSATFTDSTIAGSCEGEKIITRTWNLTDDCGNLTEKIQKITIKDTIKPTFTVPNDITIFTDASCAFDASVGKTGEVSDESDNCDTTLSATFTDATIAGICEGEKIITRTWNLTDDCGNSTEKTQKITVKDTIKPTFTVPNDAIIYADSTCNFDSSVAKTGDVSDESDNCDTTLNATFIDVEIAGTCEGEKIITRTWNLTDDCGNSTEKIQKITVKDTVKPTFTVPNDITIFTDASCAFDSSVEKTGDVSDESDNCDTTLVATFTDATIAGTCEGEKIITRTWNLIDDCGNSTEKIQKITVKDIIKPTFTVPNDITIFTDASCAFDASVGKTGEVSDESDNCDTTLVATFTDVTIAGTCEGEKIITRTWNLTDDCGNSTEKTQKITVKDTIKPTFTVPNDAIIYADENCNFDLSVEKTGEVSDESDNCDTTLSATFTDATIAGTCEGEKIITRTWNLTDDCGNSTEKTQKITVKDTIKPTFIVPNDITIFTDASCAFDSSVAKTGDVSDEADNCSTGLKATFTDVEKTGTCEGTKIITRTWNLTDSCGNSTQKDQIITVEDNIKPTFTAPADITISTDANCTFDVSVGKTGEVSDESDNCDTTLVATFTDATIAGTCEGEKIITRTWNLTDDCGNSTEKTQKITVKDTIKPTFTVPNDAIIYADSTCNFDSSVAKTGDVSDESDNCDTTLNATFIDVEIAGICEGEKIITRTWNLTDDCGNLTEKTQKITVKDNIKPTFTVPNDVIIYADENCNFDASVEKTGDVSDESDNCDTTLSATFTDATIAGSCEGEKIITRTWNLTDDCGNSTEKTQKITVKDNIKPTFTVPNDITIFTDASCNFDLSVGKTGDVSDESDNCDTTLNATFIDVEIAGICEGEKIITRTWNLTDDCGNSTEKTQKITVKDNIKPTFTVPNDITISTDKNCSYDVSKAITGDVTDEADNCSTGLKATFTDVEIAGNCDGSKTITRTWNLTDSCGNSIQKDQIITVEDNIKPTFTAPNDAIIYADSTCNFDSSVAKTGDVSDESDNCSTGLKATFTDVEKTGTCEGTKIITRTWNLTDSCGNSTQKDQIITVEDNIKPTFTAPKDITISTDKNCSYDVSKAITGDVTDEADNCSTGLKATFTDVEIAGICEGEKIITRTWNLTDDCGNSTEKVQKITVKDTIKPTFTVPNDITIFTDANCDFDVSVEKTGDVSDESDNCSTGLKATFTDVEKAGTCEGTKTITRTWILTDSCGNSTQKDQIITVEDNIKPTFTAPDNITISTDANCDFDVSVAKTGGVSDESDNCDTTLVATFTDATIAGSCEGEKIITRTWNLTDDCGNLTEKTQKITVKDNIKPTFTVPNDAIIYADSTCNFDSSVGKTGDVSDESDNCDTTLNATFIDVEIAGICEGEKIITRTWNLTDDCGNSTEKTQKITVKDTIKPTFTVPNDITIFTDANCTFDVSVGKTGEVSDESDNCDTTLNATFIDVEIAGICEGEKIITRTWNLTDDCGNSTEKIQKITVKDTIKPTFTVPNDITIFTDASCDFDSSVAKTGEVSDESDNCDTTLSATFTDAITAGSCQGEKIITRTWNLTDDCGNLTEKIQKITVKDTIKPTFTVPNDVIIYADENCNFDASVGKTGDVSDESDNCDTTLNATFIDVEIAGTCEGEKIITRTWNLTDDCGNSTEKIQKITVKDIIKPILVSSFEEVINVKCDAIPEIPTLEFSDNCSENSTQINYEENNMFDGTDSDYKIVRTWTVTDGCGNIAEFIQTINVTVKTVATRIADSKCNNDGIINLNDYIIDNTALSGKWKVTQGDVFLSDEATFDPSNTTLGDYVFTYTISNEGCLKATEITININDDCMVLPCGQDDIKISKAVTPNGDSWNQFFEISGTESCGFVVNVKIFNRWGAKVFESNDYRNNWNGVSNGSTFGSDKILPTGTYYYIVLLENSGLKPFTGAIFLGTK
ncbi:gliding motility-associated C-terminal domain-containing protein [Tenacibaculum finnmarkense]|uniref:T9SS type B sorting domain-containing protein n=2 Tax=Tenacibaculum finnmarkense TaxID=2781243 RepID=UPI001EFB10B3|nr:gliding motility-associated C-terminal domain-containing protein [Tenacibaculum finnmarkense]MCG8748945.1 VWA domain-containing protein [Tenacibaculum finnmarkense]